MKAQMDANGGGGGGHGGGVRDGKVHKAKHHSHHHHPSGHQKVENAEIKQYLNKLQELVPFMPKNRKLSKLEVITHVIDYIRDLRQTLGLPPCNNDFDMESMLAATRTPAISLNVINNSATFSSSNVPTSVSSHHPRQPLCVISSNPSGSAISDYSHEIPPQLMDKSPSTDVDTRAVSC